MQLKMEKKINYIATDQEINATVVDFESFCHFIEERNPKLSMTKEVLGKNVLFDINKLLKYRKDVAQPNFPQESYPIIDLIFKLTQLGKLYAKKGDEKGNLFLERTSRKLEFDTLNSFEKYSFLFETFWTQYDFREILMFGNSMDDIIQTIAKSRPGQKLIKGAFSKKKDHDPVFAYSSVLVHYFSFFGFCTFIPIINETKKLTKYDDNIQAVIPTEFGVNICKILTTEKVTKWNNSWVGNSWLFFDDEEDDDLEEPDKNNDQLFRYLEPVFPKGDLLHTINTEIVKVAKGNFTFKVSLGKSVWRKIKLSFKHSLEDLHLAIQEAFDFDNDHLYSFYMDGKRRSRNAFHSLLGDEGPYTDEAIIGNLGLYVGQKILYYFDYGDSWGFAVQLLTIDEGERPLKKPKVIESKGEAPEQYGFDEEDDFFDFDEEDENDEDVKD